MTSSGKGGGQVRPEDFVDYYAILSVTTDAPLGDIEKAVRKARVAYAHNRKMLRDIEEGWNTLRYPKLREEYDKQYPDRRAAFERAVEEKRAETLASQIKESDALTPAPAVSAAAVEAPKTSRRGLAWFVVLGITLAGAAGVYNRMQHGYLRKTFQAGDELVSPGGKRFGVLREVSASHEFPGGKSAPAYLVETEGGRTVWLPQNDVKANFDAPR